MHTIIKSKFLSIITKRPALFRELVDPTPELIALCLSQNSRVLNLLDNRKINNWLSLDALKAYLNLRLSINNSLPIRRYQEDSVQEVIKAFPLSVRKLIEPDLLTAVINWTPYLIKHFPQADYNMWKSALSLNECTNITPEDIPEEFLNDELKKLYLINSNSYYNSADKLWTNAIVDDVLQAHPSYINHVPEELWNTTSLRLALSLLEEDGTPVRLERDIPLVLCDDDIADKATELNYNKIPVKYRTYDRSLRAVRASGSFVEDVPSKILDLNIVVEAMGSCHPDEIPEKFMSHKGFLYTIAERDYQDYLNNAPIEHYQRDNTRNPRYCLRLQKFLRRARLGFGENRFSSFWDDDILNGKDRTGNKIQYNPKYFSWDLWPDVLKHCPAAIRLIPKEFQTEEMLTQFFKNGNTTFFPDNGTQAATVIAELANFLHIGKIKKYHADLLTSEEYANVDSTLLQEVIQRKFKKGSHPIVRPVIPVETVTVDITDSVYRSLDEEYHVTVPYPEPRVILINEDPEPENSQEEEDVVEPEPIPVPVVRTVNPHRKISRLTSEE